LSLSNDISLVNLANIFKYFLISLSLLIGQTSVFSTVDIKLSLSVLSRGTYKNRMPLSISVMMFPHVMRLVLYDPKQ
jgi:hypothetical protein